MALQRPAEAWQAAQRLADAGQFDYYRLTAAQHSLLETAWQALYPSTPYPCSTRSCPGRIREAHRQLLAELKYHLSQPITTTTVDNTNNQTAGQAAATATPNANPTAAPAGQTTPADNANTPPTPPTNAIGTPVASHSQPQEKLGTPSQRYQFAAGVTEVREFGNPIPHTRVTDALVERLLKASPDYARLFIDNEEADAEAAVDTAVARQEAELLGGSLQDKDKGPKLPSPSALKQMNKDELTSQYRQELEADEVPAELDTNAKIAAAILQHREASAE